MANDILKKYVKQSQKKMKPLTQKSGSWVMNVLKSAGYTGMDVITELAPSTMETAKATATIGKDVATTLKGARTSDRSLKNALDKSFYVGLGKRFLQNSLEDLKTGKFYNKERKDALFNNGDDDFDLDFDFGDEDFDSNFDDFSDTVESSDGETVASFKRKKGKNVEITNIDVNTDMGPDSTIVQATEFQTETMINVGQAMVDESRTENRAMMTMLGTIRNEVGTSLASMADNVSQITSVVSEHLSQHITLSSKFFEDSLSIQQQILDQLKANAEGKAGTGINTREFKEYQDIMDLFETGGEGFDFKSYGDIVKRQFGNYVNNNMLLSAIKMMDSNREALEQWVASPWESTLKAVFNKAIPEIVQKSVSAFDEQLKETGVALFNQINGLQRSNNPILSGLGQIFGLQNKITLSKVDKSAYNKGEMAWTGIDHQALTNVIPTFLRKIYAAVSGKQEVAFDFQNGVWKNLADIEKGFADDKVRRETSGFSDYKSEFTDFLNTFAIGSNEKEEYKEAFNKFIGKLVTDSKGGRTFRLGGRSGNETDGFGKRDDIRELLGAASSDDMNVKMIRAYLQSLEETNKAQLTRFFGSAVQEQRATIDAQMREMQQDPIRFNTMYMDTGLTRENGTNSHLKFEDKNDKRKVTGVKTTAGGVGSMVDEYKNTTNYYLREILKTLNTGIYVLPVTELAGVSASTNSNNNPDGSPKTEKQKEKERRKALRDEYRRMEATGLQGQQLRDAVRENVEIRDGNNAAFNDIRIRRNEVTAKLKDQRTKRSKERSAYERRDNYNEEKRQKDIQRGMTALDTEMTQEQITTAYAEHLANRTEENVEEKTMFDKLIDMLPETSGARKLVDNFNKKRSEVGSAIESKVNVATTALFDLVFGDADGKRGMDKLFQRVMAFARTQFTKFGKFLDDKVLTPLNDALFGDDGLVSKIKQTDFGKKMSEIFGKLTGNLSNFVFGEMGPDGKRINGLFSSTLNALKDIGTYVKDGILGMKGPDGKPLPLDQDNSVLGNLKRMTRSISNNIKDALGVGEAPNRLPLSTRIADTIDAMFTRVKERSSDWTNAIFGDENLNISTSTKFFMDSFSQDFKQDMKENKGFIAATSSLGLLSSFFLPGGPIGGALIGAGVGIITKSRGLKDILFGPEDKYGDRIGGIITKGTQDFFKEHKMAMIGGAGLGLASSIGLLPSFFLPGGPIGGALIGTSVSLIAKSGAFNELLYGKGGTKDDPTGGLKKKFKEVFGKAKDSKGIAIDAGIGAGVGIIGSFFLPGGPILGALIGSAISVGTATDKFRTWMFGPEGEDGKRAGGMFGKVKGTMEDFLFGKAGNDGVRHNGLISRLTTTAKLAQDKISEFIQVNMVTPVKYAMAPILAEAKDIKDAIKSKVTKLFTAVKDKITSVVIKPVGDGIKKHFLDPMKNLFLKLFKGFGKTLGLIMSAPFKAVGLTGDALNFKHKLQGKDSYDPELRAKRKQEIADIRAEHARKREAIKAGTDENTQRRRSIFDWRRKDRAKDDQTRLDDDMYDVLQEANGIETDNLRILNPKDKSNNTKVKATPEYEGPSGLDVLAEAQGRPTSKEANGKPNTEDDASANKTQNTTVATTPTANTDAEEPSGLDILAEANGIIGGEESDNTRVSTTESSDEESRTVSRKKDRKAKRQKKKENKRKKEERRRGVTDDTRVDVPSNEPTPQIPTTEEEPSGLDILAQANTTEDTRVNTTTPETEVTTVVNTRTQERPQNTEVSTNVPSTEENVVTPTVETPSVPNTVVRELTQGTNVSNTRVENVVTESEPNNTHQERVTGTNTTINVPSVTGDSEPTETNKPVSLKNNTDTRVATTDTGEETGSDTSKPKSSKGKGTARSIQSDVSKISDSVYGQLNGVGRNVYKIYKLLLKKFNESDENIDGENNKEYVGFFGKIKTALNNPIKFVKNAITAPFRKIGEAITGVVGKIKGFGKKLFDAGKTIVTGVFNFGKDLIGGMFDFGKNLVTGLADSAKFLVENIGKGLAAIGGVAVDVIHTGLSAVREAVPIIGDVVRTGIDVLGDGLRAASSALVTGVNIIGDGLSAASSLLVTGVETVGNVISGAATGIGELLGGAMSGLGSVLSAVGLISVEAVKGVIGAGKFVAGGLAKGIKGAGSAVFGAVKRVVSPKIYHVVVDGGSIDIVKYVGTVGGTVPEDLLSNVSNDTLDDTTRVSEESMTDENSETPRKTIFETIDRLNSVISSFIDRIKGGSGEESTGIDSEDTRLSVPSNEEPAIMESSDSEEVSEEDEEAPKGKFGNFMSKFISDENKTKLSNKVKTAKATVGGVFSNATNSVREKLKRKDEQERAEQADRGSRSSVEAKIAEEDKTEQEATFREKMLSLLGRGADASETHSSSFLKVFDIKKGLITAGLIALAPFVFKLFKKFNIGEILSNLLSSISDGFKEVGGLIGMINRTKDQKEQVEDAMNGTDTHYQLDENGNLVYDEDGNIKKETTMSSHIVEAVTPTVTRTNLETGEFENKKVWTQKSGAIAKKGTQIALTGAGTAIRVGEKVSGTVSKVAGTAKRLGGSIINSKNFNKVAEQAVENGSNVLKPSPVGGVANTVSNVTENVVKNTGDDVAEAVTKTSVAKKIGNGVKTAAAAVKNKAAKDDGIISKAINFMLNSADNLIAKLAELGPKFGIKLPVSKFSSVLGVLKNVLKPANLQKFASKISKFIKTLTAKHSLGPISLTLMDAGFMLYGAVEGASNAAGVFEVDSSEVDGKMRAIASIFKAFLGTSIGGWLDLAASICYEITGVNWIKEIATAAYNIISNDEDDAALKAAQDKFTEDYEAHVDEAYEAYAKHAEETGKEVMSKEEYIQEGLAPSRSEYNSERNKSLFKKGVDAVGGLFKKKDKNKTAVNTTVPKSYADYSKEVTSKGGTPMSEEEYNTSVKKQSKKKGFFANAKDKVETKLLGIADAQDKFMANAKDKVETKLLGIADAQDKFMANAKDKVETTLLNIGNFEDEIVEKISGGFSNLFGKIGGFVGGVVNDAKAAASGISDGITKIIATYHDKSKDFKDYFNEDINNIDEGNRFYGLANTALNTARGTMLPIMIILGIIGKISKGASNIVKSIIDKAKGVVSVVSTNTKNIIKYTISGDSQGILDTVNSVKEDESVSGLAHVALGIESIIATPIANTINTIKNAIKLVKDVIGKVKTAGKDIVSNSKSVLKYTLSGDMEGLTSLDATVDENNPIAGFTSTIVGIEKIIASPIAMTISSGKRLIGMVKDVIGKVKTAGKDIVSNSKSVLKYTLSGDMEGLTSLDATVDENNPIAGVTSSIVGIEKIIASPIAMTISSGKRLIGMVKDVIGKVKTAGKDIVSNSTAVLKYALSGDTEGLSSLDAKIDENNPIAGVTSSIVGIEKIIASPIAMVVSTGKNISNKVKDVINKSIAAGKTVLNTSGNIVKYAITGNTTGYDSIPYIEEASGPIAHIANTIIDAEKTALYPIMVTVSTGKAMFNAIRSTIRKSIDAGKSVLATSKTLISYGISGDIEGFSGVPYIDAESGPISHIANVIIDAEKTALYPIAVAVSTGKAISKKIKTVINKSIETGKTVLNTSGNIVKYAITGDSDNFNKIPYIEDESNPVSHIANAVIDAEKTALYPIMVSVSTGKAMVNAIKNAIGKAIDYGKKTKEFVTKLNTYTDPEKSLNGWDSETMATNDDDYIGGMIGTVVKKIMWTYVGLVRTVKNVFGWIGDTASTAVDTVKEGLNNTADKVKDFASDAAEGISNAFNGVGTFLMDLGRGGKDGGRPIYGKGETANGYPYYSQNDPKYKNKQYKQTGGRGETAPDTMGDSGCGPTAMAMVASKITGKEYDPMTMAKMSEAGGYSTSLGTSPEYFTSAANTLGINSSLSDPTSENLQASLAGGNSVILQGVKSASNNSPFTSEGHYVTVVGLDKDNVIVNDPRGKEYSGQYKMKDVIGDTTGMWSFNGGGKGGVRDRISSKIKKKLRRGGKGTDDWLNVVKTVKAKVAEQHPTYHNPNPVSITINAYGKDLRVRCDCSGLVSAYLVVYGVAPEGTSLTSGAFADPNNATMKSTGFQSAAWSGWENLQPGDIIARNGHVEVFARNDGSSHKVYNGGSTDSLGNPGETYTGHKEGYTTVWRCGDVSGLATTSGTDAYTASMADNGSYASSGNSSSSESGGVSSFSELLAGAANAFVSPFLEAFGFKTSAAESSGSTGSMSGGTSSGGFVTAANLSGSENAEKAFNFLVDRNYTPAGAAGLLGNLYAESHILPNNLQDSGNRSTGMSDEQYTSAVDNGSYSRFSKDSIGYGLAQWTSGGRKENLLNFAKQHGTSIGDLGMQLSFLDQEMQSGYKPVYNTLTTTSDLKAASDIVLHKFEAPADQSAAVENTRASYGQAYYNQYANKLRSTGSTSVSGPVGSSQYIPGTNILKPGYSSTTTTSGPTGSSQYIPGTSILKPGGNGGTGSGKPVKPASGGMGSTGGYDKVYQAPGTISNPTQDISKIIDNIGTSGSMSTADMKKMVATIIEYLSNIVDNTGSTSEGIDKLNSKDFGSTNNMTNNFVSDNSSTIMNADNTTGRTVDKSSDRSKYSMAKRVAAGILT